MELNELIRSRAYRCLRPLKSFQGVDHAVNNLPDEVRLGMLRDEELIGIYQNSTSDPLANLIFTTSGVYRFEGGWRCLEYAQILRVTALRGENFDKQTADTLLLRMEDGWLVKLPVSGAVVKTISGYERRFPDLWEVLRYLDRVVERVKRG